MKFIILVLPLFSLSGNALAEKLVSFSSITGSPIYLDLDSVKKDGDFVTFNVLDKPDNPKFIRKAIMEVKSSCNENYFEYLKQNYTYVDGSSKVVIGMNNKVLKKYAPNSYLDAITQYSCGKRTLEEALSIKQGLQPPCNGDYC